MLGLKISPRDTLAYSAFILKKSEQCCTSKKSIQWNVTSNLVTRQTPFFTILSKKHCLYSLDHLILIQIYISIWVKLSLRAFRSHFFYLKFSVTYLGHSIGTKKQFGNIHVFGKIPPILDTEKLLWNSEFWDLWQACS